MAETILKDIFCAKEQAVTSHKGYVDSNGEFVFSCQSEGCDRFVKFPADTTPEQFAELLAKHEAHNTGQISLEKQQAKLMGLVAAQEESQPEEPAQ